ncbi:hypothetical protein DRQ09_08910 [candidate division KSB1 bacterium]|nr:MAG: hypothetical protein DRQ09_08910 [candidate division KSB1 bacterium]
MNKKEILNIICKYLDTNKLQKDYPELSKNKIKNFFIEIEQLIEKEEKKHKILYLYVDGVSKGNPGDSGIGVLILSENNEIIEEYSEFIGFKTNNVAEYTALIRGIEKAILYNPDELKIFSDSKLIVNQINGKFKIKSKSMIQLYEKVKKLLNRLRNYTISCIPREQNYRADQLANLAVGKNRLGGKNERKNCISPGKCTAR